MITDAAPTLRDPIVISADERRPGEAATRRMCAGMVLDALFRDELLRKVYNDRTRRVAPSYGFDLVVVLRYAWRAWWLDLCLRCTLVTALALSLVKSPLDTIIAISGLTAWFMLRKVPDWADGLTRYYYQGEGPESDIRRIESNGKTLGFAALVSVAILAICVALSLSASNRAGSTASWVSKTGLAGAAVITLAWASLVAAAALVRLAWLRRLRNADPRPPRRLGRRMTVINTDRDIPGNHKSGWRRAPLSRLPYTLLGRRDCHLGLCPCVAAGPHPLPGIRNSRPAPHTARVPARRQTINDGTSRTPEGIEEVPG